MNECLTIVTLFVSTNSVKQFVKHLRRNNKIYKDMEQNMFSPNDLSNTKR